MKTDNLISTLTWKYLIAAMLLVLKLCQLSFYGFYKNKSDESQKELLCW